MIYRDFTDFSIIEDLVTPELPDLARATVREQAARVWSDFCEQSQCFRERIDMPVLAGDRHVDLVSPHLDHIIVGVEQVTGDKGEPYRPGDYQALSPTTLELSDKLLDMKLSCTVVLKPLATTMQAPTQLLQQYAEHIASGVRANLMEQPGTPWYQPQLASYHRNRYEQGILQANANVRAGQGVTRQHRRQRRQSIYY